MGSRRQLYTVAVLALTLAALPSAEAYGQGIGGTVRHRTTGESLPGVLVSVIGLDGERVRGVLSDGTGGFAIEVPMGRYRLRAERIGLLTEVSEEFDLKTLNMRFHRIEMVERAVEIEGFVVDSRVQSCRIDEKNATRIQRWWSEIRTALDVSAALQRERFGSFLVERFQREWDEDLREVIASNRSVTVSVSTRPFVSAPVGELVSDGFVRGDYGLDRLYFGPDADVVVSSAFLARHCFSLRDQRGAEGQLGLHFEPVEGREVTEVEGTLWIDTTTAELKDLDFQYVNLEGPDRDEAGGSIVFEYLPSGAWIVSHWYIRVPRTGVRRRRRVTVGYFDEGGSVTQLSLPEPSGAEGAIRGLVADSLRGGGLGGARVTILGTASQTTTDDDGRFGFLEVPVGSYHLSFEHDELEVWGLEPDYLQIDVEEGVSAEAELYVPTFERAALALCLGEGVGAETVVVGHVLGPNREPRPGQALRFEFERPGARSMAELTLRTDEQGGFTVCSAPGGSTVALQARLGDRWEHVTDFVPAGGELTYREIWFTR